MGAGDVGMVDLRVQVGCAVGINTPYRDIYPFIYQETEFETYHGWPGRPPRRWGKGHSPCPAAGG